MRWGGCSVPTLNPQTETITLKYDIESSAKGAHRDAGNIPTLSASGRGWGRGHNARHHSYLSASTGFARAALVT